MGTAYSYCTATIIVMLKMGIILRFIFIVGSCVINFASATVITTTREDDDDEIIMNNPWAARDSDGTWKPLFEEEDEIGYARSLIVDMPPVVSLQSPHQNIQVYNSDHYGKVLELDDCLQLTERDAAHYNEMLAHVPVMEYLARRRNSEPIKALVIGGGDGYVVSELLKYKQISSIDHVELDEEVVNVSKEHLPWADAWNDERVNLVIGDGASFVKNQAERGKSYHVIIQDASDPYWLGEDGTVHTLPSSVLYDASHFESLYGLLRKKEGVLIFQSETYNLPSNLQSIRKWRKLLEGIGFEKPRYGSISIGTYSTGQHGFFVAHARQNGAGKEKYCTFDKMDLLPELNWDQILAQFAHLKGTTLYYHPRIHRSSFDLPIWVEEVIYGDVSVLPASTEDVWKENMGKPHRNNGRPDVTSVRLRGMR